jgi:GntR family transcriptional regulator
MVATFILNAAVPTSPVLFTLTAAESVYYNTSTVSMGDSMKRLLKIAPADAIPIWRQIEDGIRRLVASGVLAPDDPLPSVRDLAKDLVVNPATVAKAYQRLADAGVVTVRRGEGTFVAARPPVLGKAEFGRILREAAIRYASVASTIGASPEEAVDALRAVFSGYQRAAGGNR